MTFGARWAWWALIAACVVLAAPSLADSRGAAAVDCHLLGLVLVAGGLVLGVRRMPSADRAGWAWIAGGCLSGVVGSVLWELPVSPPTFHGIAVQDLCWLAVYPLILRGVLARIAGKGLGADVRRSLLLDRVVVTSAASVVAWHLMIGPAVGQYASAGLLVTGFAVAYPLGDVSVFALGAVLLVTRARRGVPEGLLVVALGAELPMDLVNAVVVARAPDVGDGWYRAGYLLVNGMIAAAVLYPRAAVPAPDGDVAGSTVHGWRVAILGAGLSGICLSTIFMPEAGWRRLPVAVAVVAALIAVIVRFHRGMGALESAERVLRHQATHDQLTGAANRALLLTELDAAVRTRVPALIFIDLDGFKLVNDSLGHQAGDEVLLAVTRRLASVVRQEYLVARMGGDEFIVVCRTPGEVDVEKLAERIGDAVRRPLDVAGSTVTVGASVGVLLPAPGAGGVDGDRAGALVTELLGAADGAMYDAKRSRSGVRVVRHGVPAGPLRPSPA